MKVSSTVNKTDQVACRLLKGTYLGGPVDGSEVGHKGVEGGEVSRGQGSVAEPGVQLEPAGQHGVGEGLRLVLGQLVLPGRLLKGGDNPGLFTGCFLGKTGRSDQQEGILESGQEEHKKNPAYG